MAWECGFNNGSRSEARKQDPLSENNSRVAEKKGGWHHVHFVFRRHGEHPCRRTCCHRPSRLTLAVARFVQENKKKIKKKYEVTPGTCLNKNTK